MAASRPLGFWRFALASDRRALRALWSEYRRPVPVMVVLGSTLAGVVVETVTSGGWSSVTVTVLAAGAGAVAGLLVLLTWHVATTPAAIYDDLYRHVHVLDDLDIEAPEVDAWPAPLSSAPDAEHDGYLILLDQVRIVNTSTRRVSLSFVFHCRSTENPNRIAIPEDDFGSHKLKNTPSVMHSGLELDPDHAKFGSMRFLVHRHFTDAVLGADDSLSPRRLLLAEKYLEVKDYLSKTVRFYQLPTARPPLLDLPESGPSVPAAPPVPQSSKRGP